MILQTYILKKYKQMEKKYNTNWRNLSLMLSVMILFLFLPASLLKAQNIKQQKISVQGQLSNHTVKRPPTRIDTVTKLKVYQGGEKLQHNNRKKRSL